MTVKKQDSPNLNNSTIMIVDDERATLDMVKVFLEKEQHRNLFMVEDSTLAMKTLEEKRPDLLLLDLIMPDVSGFEILAMVRAHQKFKHLPVIIMTAAGDMENKLKALELGATDFLGKPLDQSELGLRVRNNLAAKAYQDQLAYYNGLTRLPNRHLFLEALSWALKAAKHHNEELALLQIEIDNFNKVNDSIGYDAGDEVVRIVARRILNVIWEMDEVSSAHRNDDAENSLYHPERRVFSLLIDRIQGAEDAASIAERIIKDVRAPIQVEGMEVYMTVSVGIVTYPAESNDSSELVRCASRAMEYAKKLGGDSFQFYSHAINSMYEERLRLEAKLRRAVEKEEYVLHFQPKVDVQTGDIKGVEALVRWNNSGTLIPPDEFIPLAEETGLIIPLGEWVLREACRVLYDLQQAGKSDISMSVNLSARQFADPDFLLTVKRIIVNSDIDPRSLILELTESLLLENIDDKLNVLRYLKEMGLKLSIDDFGTAYSSLNYLRKLPVDELKIDRSFIMEMTENEDSRAIVSSIIFLAQQLNLTTVAEGVEKNDELRLLQILGCHEYQGFIFSRPVPEDKLFEMLSLVEV